MSDLSRIVELSRQLEDLGCAVVVFTEEIMMPKEEEISDDWTMAKDGKTYIDPIIRDNDPDWLKEVKTKIMRK